MYLPARQGFRLFAWVAYYWFYLFSRLQVWARVFSELVCPRMGWWERV